MMTITSIILTVYVVHFYQSTTEYIFYQAAETSYRTLELTDTLPLRSKLQIRLRPPLKQIQTWFNMRFIHICSNFKHIISSRRSLLFCCYIAARIRFRLDTFKLTMVPLVYRSIYSSLHSENKAWQISVLVTNKSNIKQSTIHKTNIWETVDILSRFVFFMRPFGIIA